MRVLSEDEKTYITMVELHDRPTELNFEFYNVGGSYFATLKARALSKNYREIPLMKFDNDIITFPTGVSRPIALDQCSRIIYLMYLMLISLFSFVVFNVSVCVYFITYRLQFVIYM